MVFCKSCINNISRCLINSILFKGDLSYNPTIIFQFYSRFEYPYSNSFKETPNRVNLIDGLISII